MEEKEIVRMSMEGDEEAFRLLVEKYKKKVFNMAFSLTRDREVADDLTQDIFIKVYFSLPGFKFKSKFGTWLYTIASNRIKDYLRKTKKMRRVIFEKSRENDLFHENIAVKKEKEQLDKLKKELVHTALQALPEKHQIILSLRDIQGFPYEKIAEILNISPGTVDSRLHRARKQLRKKISPFLSQIGGNP